MEISTLDNALTITPSDFLAKLGARAIAVRVVVWGAECEPVTGTASRAKVRDQLSKAMPGSRIDQILANDDLLAITLRHSVTNATMQLFARPLCEVGEEDDVIDLL